MAGLIRCTTIVTLPGIPVGTGNDPMRLDKIDKGIGGEEETKGLSRLASLPNFLRCCSASLVTSTSMMSWSFPPKCLFLSGEEYGPFPCCFLPLLTKISASFFPLPVRPGTFLCTEECFGLDGLIEDSLANSSTFFYCSKQVVD